MARNLIIEDFEQSLSKYQLPAPALDVTPSSKKNRSTKSKNNHHASSFDDFITHLLES